MPIQQYVVFLHNNFGQPLFDQLPVFLVKIVLKTMKTS